MLIVVIVMSEKRLNPTHVEVPVEPISKTGHIIATQQIEATVDGPQQVTPKFVCQCCFLTIVFAVVIGDVSVA